MTAPDNPWVASPHPSGAKYAYGSMWPFGGTSGASPHVTGVAALLAQAGIQGDAARDAIRAGAVSDATTGTVPNGDYGFGRLDAAGALGAKKVGKDPSVQLSFTPAAPTVRDTVELVAHATSGDGNDAALEVKWDDGYDGAWETSYAAPAPHAVVKKTAGKYPFKVRARNSGGHIAEAVAWVTIADAPPPMPAPSPTMRAAPGAPLSPGGGCGCRAAPVRGDYGISGLALGALLVPLRLRLRTRGGGRGH